jgi:hypothetical protein
MARPSSDEGQERVRNMARALLVELVRAPAGGSDQAMADHALAEHALRVDGLADDLLAADAEGGVLFLGDLVVRMLEAYCLETGADRLEALQKFLGEPGDAPLP